MRTRAQKLANAEETTQNLQRRLREIAAQASAPLSPPASKKRKTNDVPASPLLLTPHHPKPRTPTLTVCKTPSKVANAKTNVKRVAIRRTLQYKAPVIPEPLEDPQTVLQRICTGHKILTYAPIVGRVGEHQVVRQVLKGADQSSLFIIGPPGTGKSSSVNELLEEQGYETVEMTSSTNRKRVRKSDKTAVKLNCSTFTVPAALYAAIAHQVNQSTSWCIPETMDPFALDAFVAMQRGANAKRQSVVVVLDEVDQLLRLPVRMQPRVKEMLHFFVRWAEVAPSDVKFLGIMNGVDMYEQVSRVQVTGGCADDSRVPRVVFGSYSHQDLLLIVQSYVQSASRADISQVAHVIEPLAIEFIARKVAARDGDARLAISLLQQSARHALQCSSVGDTEKSTASVKVTVRDVSQCAKSMLSSPIVQQIKQLPRQAKLLLYVITTLAPGSNENIGISNPKRSLQLCDMNQVSEELARLRGLPKTAWVPRLSREELQTHLMSLDCYALVKQGKRSDKSSRPAAMSVRAFWTTKLSSCVAMAEVSRALQGDTSLSQLLM